MNHQGQEKQAADRETQGSGFSGKFAATVKWISGVVVRRLACLRLIVSLSSHFGRPDVVLARHLKHGMGRFLLSTSRMTDAIRRGGLSASATSQRMDSCNRFGRVVCSRISTPASTTQHVDLDENVWINQAKSHPPSKPRERTRDATEVIFFYDSKRIGHNTGKVTEVDKNGRSRRRVSHPR